MKLTRLLTCLFLSIMGMSCIQDEAPNAEADILTCTVPATYCVAILLLQMIRLH